MVQAVLLAARTRSVKCKLHGCSAHDTRREGARSWINRSNLPIRLRSRLSSKRPVISGVGSPRFCGIPLGLTLIFRGLETTSGVGPGGLRGCPWSRRSPFGAGADRLADVLADADDQVRLGVGRPEPLANPALLSDQETWSPPSPADPRCLPGRRLSQASDWMSHPAWARASYRLPGDAGGWLDRSGSPIPRRWPGRLRRVNRCLLIAPILNLGEQT